MFFSPCVGWYGELTDAPVRPLSVNCALTIPQEYCLRHSRPRQNTYLLTILDNAEVIAGSAVLRGKANINGVIELEK